MTPFVSQFLALSPRSRAAFLSTLTDDESVKLHHGCLTVGRGDDFTLAAHILAAFHESVVPGHHLHGEKMRLQEQFGHASRTKSPGMGAAALTDNDQVPHVPAFCHLNEWQQLLAYAAMSHDERAALQMELISADQLFTYQRAASSLDYCGPAVQSPHVYLRRKLDLFAHFEATFGIDDPAAELAAAASKGGV